MTGLESDGLTIALYIVAATHRATKAENPRNPTVELDVMFAQRPDVAKYVSGTLHNIKETSYRDILLQQPSAQRFFVLNPGKMENDCDALAAIGSRDWPDIKKMIDDYLA